MRRTVAEKDGLIGQYARMTEDQATAIVRLHAAVASQKGRVVADAIRDGGYDKGVTR